MTNTKTKDNKNPRVGKTIHGGYQAVARYRKKGLDLRRRDDRALKEWRDAVIGDCGGIEKLDNLQLSLLDRCIECLIILGHMGAYVTQHGPMQGPDLIPCLRNSYVAYLNTFERLLRTIYERTDKRPQRGPSYAEVVEKLEAKSK